MGLKVFRETSVRTVIPNLLKILHLLKVKEETNKKKASLQIRSHFMGKVNNPACFKTKDLIFS